MIRHTEKNRINIAVIGKTSYEYLVFCSGVLSSGNVFVPFSPEISAVEAADLFERADIEMLLYEQEFADKAEELFNTCPQLKNICCFSQAAEIYETYNQKGELDIDSIRNNQVQTEDDFSAAYVIIQLTRTNIMTYIILAIINVAINKSNDININIRLVIISFFVFSSLISISEILEGPPNLFLYSSAASLKNFSFIGPTARTVTGIINPP